MSFDIETTIGQHKYMISRMSVFDEYQVASDYRDILVGLALAAKGRPDEKKMSDAEFTKAVQFIITSRAGVTPEIRARVVNTCLAHIKRHANVGWQNVLADDNTMQFADIRLNELTQLLYASFVHNRLLDFFSESLSVSDRLVKKDDGQHSQTEKTGS